MFTPELVDHPKPSPDLHILAAAQFDAARHRCVLIEDSTTGVAAGVAAGIPVIGFTGGSHAQPGHDDVLLDAGAQVVTRDAAQLAGLIASIDHLKR